MDYYVVKILNNGWEDIKNPVWCLVVERIGDNVTLCSGQLFREMHNDNRYELKRGNRKDVTCESCKKVIRYIKGIK